MPFQSCQKDGKTGTKWGKHGACYTGKDAKKKAEKQRRAIEISKHTKGDDSWNLEKFLQDYRQGKIDIECCK